MIKYYDLSDYWTNSIDKEVQRGTKLREEKLELCPISQDYDVVDIDFDQPYCSSTYKKKSSNRSPTKFSSRYNFIYPNRSKKRKIQKNSKNIQSKYNKIKCPIRILELSVPTKRHCLQTWRDNQGVLPTYMVDRLRQIIMDEKPVVQLNDAVNYFKTRKHSKSRPTIVKIKKLNTKEMQKFKILSAILAFKITQKLLRPLNISLNQQLKNLSQVINKEISTIMNDSKKLKNKTNSKIQNEIANMVTVWIADILEESECKIILEDYEDLRKREEPVWDLLDGLVDKVTAICVPEIVESESTTELISQFTPISSRIESSLVSQESIKNVIGTTQYDTVKEANIFVSMLLDILKDIDYINERKLTHNIEKKSVIFDEIKKIIDELLNYTCITSNANIENNSNESVQNIRKSTQDFKDKDTSLNNFYDNYVKLTEESNINEANGPDTKINEVPFTNINEDPFTNIKNIKSQDSVLQEHTIQELYDNDMDTNLFDIDIANTKQWQAINELDEINDGENNNDNNKQVISGEKEVYVANFKEDTSVDNKNNKSNNSKKGDADDLLKENIHELPGIQSVQDLKNKVTDSSSINIEIDVSSNNDTVNTSRSNISIKDKILSDNDRKSRHVQNNNEIKYVNEADTTSSDEVKSMEFEDTPDDSIKKVKFSNINIDAYRGKQLNNDSKFIPTQETNIKMQDKDIWRSSKVSIDENIKSELYFAPPNDHLLSDADESWPEDLQLPILKATVSISKSIQSLGNIIENEEGHITSPQDYDLHETNVIELKTEEQLKPNDSNEANTRDVYEHILKDDKEIGENRYLNQLISNGIQFHNNIIHTLKDEKIAQTNITHLPTIHINQKIYKESVRDEVLQTDEDTSKTNIQLETTVNVSTSCDLLKKCQMELRHPFPNKVQLEFRQWCLGLENVIENLEIWKEWLQNISTYIIFLKYKEGQTTRNKRDNTKKWLKLKENIDLDSKIWFKLSKHIQMGLHSYRNHYISTEMIYSMCHIFQRQSIHYKGRI